MNVITQPVQNPDIDTSQRRGLSGKLSTFDIVFTVLAFNAPLSVFVGFIPVIIGHANHLGTPVTYMGAGALMLLFAVGFTTMSRYVKNPGAFYAYITAGLGKPMGLGSSFLALASYVFILIGGYCFGGISLQALVRDVFQGPDIAWWLYTLLLMTVAGTLGYFEISLSAKVLTAFMVAEIIVIVAFNTAAFIDGGPQGVSLTSFDPTHIFSGSVGLAVLFGIVCFSGFEATAIFREEAREPNKTIPRATYIAVIAMAGMYAVSAWGLITAAGPDQAVDASAADPTGFTLAAVSQLLSKIVMDAVIVLLCTSIFAANLATHNVTARYFYSLSMDKVFPQALSKVHVRHGSPYFASLITTAISISSLALLVIAGADGTSLYAVLVGIGGYALILLLLLTSVSVISYFWKHPEMKVSRWKTLIAPALASIGLLVGLILATQNIALMIEGSQTLANTLMVFFYSCIVVGFCLALYYRKHKPEIYARIGRQQP